MRSKVYFMKVENGEGVVSLAQKTVSVTADIPDDFNQCLKLLGLV